MAYKIRRARHEDAAGIINSHRRSIREICAKDYSPAQVAAWSGRDFQEERWRKTMDKDWVWVVADESNNIFGFGHLQIEAPQGHISGLYFVPEVKGQGFGKKIVLEMFEHCKAEGVTSVRLSATKTAKAFYESMTFKQVGGEKRLDLGGESLECFTMETAL